MIRREFLKLSGVIPFLRYFNVFEKKKVLKVRYVYVHLCHHAEVYGDTADIIQFINIFQRNLSYPIVTVDTTGLPKLDALLNEGGQSSKEVLAYLAPTGVGKSLLMTNNAMADLVYWRNIAVNRQPHKPVHFNLNGRKFCLAFAEAVEEIIRLGVIVESI